MLKCDDETRLQNIKQELENEFDFMNYIALLQKYRKELLIIIAVNDTPCGSQNFTSEAAMELMKVGFTIPLHNKWRCSYAAINDSGRLVFEGISQVQPVKCEFNLDGTKVKVESCAFGLKGSINVSRIIINGHDCAINGRGINISVFNKQTNTLFDSMCADTYAPTITCYKNGDSPLRKQIMHSIGAGITFIKPKYPKLPAAKRSRKETILAEQGIDLNMIKTCADTMHTTINEYIDSPEGICEVLSTPLAYIGTDGARHMKDFSGRYLNVINGHRITVGQPGNPKRTIYTVGGCFTLGVGTRDCGTLASQLQRILNQQAPEEGFVVENYGYFLDETNVDAELTAVVQALPLSPGDIVIGYGGIPVDASGLSRRPHKHGELFLDCKSHPTEKCNELVAAEIFKVLKKNDFFEQTLNEKPLKNALTKRNYGFTEEQFAQLDEYKAVLSAFYEQQFSEYEVPPKVGAIVMNCNPFTLGHRYLIQQCAAKVDFLVVFVVQEDKSVFPFEDRINLVDKGTEDLPNVGVIESGEFIISMRTFSEYFNKSTLQDEIIDASKDVVLFAQEIAPAMHITVRFAGSEPFDNVTRQYNRTLAGILPKYGIEFEEIERLEIDGEAVSASRVRALLDNREWSEIERLVPVNTFNYLKEKFN